MPRLGFAERKLVGMPPRAGRLKAKIASPRRGCRQSDLRGNQVRRRRASRLV